MKKKNEVKRCEKHGDLLPCPVCETKIVGEKK